MAAKIGLRFSDDLVAEKFPFASQLRISVDQRVVQYAQQHPFEFAGITSEEAMAKKMEEIQRKLLSKSELARLQEQEEKMMSRMSDLEKLDQMVQQFNPF